MAIYHEDIVSIDLTGRSLHRSFAPVSIGTGDKDANRFGVRVFRDGEPVELTNINCQGVFRNPMGENIALTNHGTVSGNVAYLTLPQACYNYEGQFCLAIKLIGGGVTGTMRIVDGMVDNTHTGGAVAPTSAVPTYQEVLATYNDAIAAIADVNKLNQAMENADAADDAYYKGENAIDFEDITEGCRIRISDGAETSANTFFSTGYIPVRQGKKVTINHTYESSTYGSVFYDDEKNKVAGFPSTAGNKVMTAPAGAAFFRTIFSDDDAETASVLITTPILDDIENRLSTVENTAEDSAERIDSDLYSIHDIDWGITASGDFQFGWRRGYWGDDGTRSNSSTNIMSVSKIAAHSGARPALNGGAFAKVELPPGKTNLVVKAFNKTTGTMVKRYDVAPGGTFDIIADCNYSFHMSGQESEITQAFVNAIKISVYYKAVINKRPYSEEYERFTVSVCSKWPDPTDTTTDDNEDEEDLTVKAIVTLPNTYTANGKPTPLIMMCHGYNGYVSDAYWNSNGADFIALLNAFKDAGFAVFDVDNTRGDTSGYGDWGSLPIMSAYIKAWEYIKQNYNVEDRLYLYSYSMGTTVALNMLKWYGNEIVTSIQTACRPICQIRYEALEDTDSRKKEIAVAFGLCTEEEAESESWVAPEWDTNRLKGFNQYEERLTIGSTDIINMKTPPVKVMIGQNDTDFQTEAIAYYTALANNGNYVNMRIVAGMNHGAIGYLTNANLREEAVRWFKRFH